MKLTTAMHPETGYSLLERGATSDGTAVRLFSARGVAKEAPSVKVADKTHKGRAFKFEVRLPGREQVTDYARLEVDKFNGVHVKVPRSFNGQILVDCPTGMFDSSLKQKNTSLIQLSTASDQSRSRYILQVSPARKSSSDNITSDSQASTSRRNSSTGLRRSFSDRLRRRSSHTRSPSTADGHEVATFRARAAGIQAQPSPTSDSSMSRSNSLNSSTLAGQGYNQNSELDSCYVRSTEARVKVSYIQTSDITASSFVSSQTIQKSTTATSRTMQSAEASTGFATSLRKRLLSARLC